MHVLAPAGEYDPAEQGVQTEEPAVAYVSGPHWLQAFEPSDGEKDPSGHVVHEAAPKVL